MTITYHGVSCLKITTKSNDNKDAIIITDPYDPKIAGIKPSRLKADVVLVSNNENKLHNNASSINPNQEQSELTIINEPGEYETKGIAFHGVFDSLRESVVYRIELEQMTIAYLGSITSSSSLSGDQDEILQNSDILIIPIGGKDVTDMKQARDIVNRLQPRMVIPIYYDVDGIKIKGLTGTPNQFIQKELGVKLHEEVNKLKITSSSLPQEEIVGVPLRMQ